MKNSIFILGGTCTEDYLYMIYTGNRILQIEKKTGIATDIIEVEKARNRFMEYFCVFFHNNKLFLCPSLGHNLTLCENGDVFNYDLGFGEKMQIVAATITQNGFLMLSQKTESFLSFNLKTHKIDEIKIENGFCEFPTMDKMNEIFWVIDRKGQVIENNQGKIRTLYEGDQKLKKYHRDNTGEYFIYLNGEVWKRSGAKMNKLAMLPDMLYTNIGCFSMDGVLYILYLDRNLIYVISEKEVNELNKDDCWYWTDEDDVMILPTIMPDKYQGGLYLYTNYQHKIIYLGLHGEVIEKPLYVRKQKPDTLMQEIQSDDLQSYYDASCCSNGMGIATLEDWITKI